VFPELPVHARDDEDDELTIVASVALVIYVDEETRFIRNQHVARHCQYVLRTDLLPNPRQGIPWQALYDNRNARAFIISVNL
jgi:hypothetical protein